MRFPCPQGGDRQLWSRRISCCVGHWRRPTRHPISPLAGEMAGRPEGRAVPPAPLRRPAQRLRDSAQPPRDAWPIFPASRRRQ
ncbi:MAG: hypothetical protein E5W81_16165 [Mesorhizobium sp.]|nr:MAG: hypothetical protein E5W81_16165 [Mesorhizobium sp.]